MLTKQQKKEKKKLHAELRGFFASHQIKLKDAAEYLGEDYNTFINCLAANRFSNEKVEGFLDRKQELLDELS